MGKKPEVTKEVLMTISGMVTKLEAETSGYGDNLRPVGISVTLKVDRVDSYGNFEQTTTIHLDKYTEQPRIGDELRMTVARITREAGLDLEDESELEEKRALWSLEDDPVLEGPDVGNGALTSELVDEPEVK